MLAVTHLMLGAYVLCTCFEAICNYPYSGDDAQEIILVEEILHYGDATAFNESTGTTLITFEQQAQGKEQAQWSSEPTDRVDNESALFNEDDLIFPVRKPPQQPAHSDEVYQIDLLTSDEEDSLTSAASTSASAEHGQAAHGHDEEEQEQVDGVPREIELRADRAAVRPIDMSDFVALIPAAEVKAIAANYYRNDAEVQHAYAFLRSGHFALLKQHIIELPEMAAFLKYLNSSGLDVVGFLYTLTNLTSKPQTVKPEPAVLGTYEGHAGHEGDGKREQTVMGTTAGTTVLGNEIEKSQLAIFTTTTATIKKANTTVATNMTTSTTTLPPDIATTTKETLNGLHGLVDSILEVLPQDLVLTTFFDKLEADEQFAKLIDSIGTPLFAKILNDLENSVPLRNLIFTLHNNGIYITRILDSLKAYFFLGTF